MMIGLVVVGTIATASGPAAAEDSHVRPARAEQTDVSWYEYDEQAEYRPNARAIVMQRAMLRAEQRQNRMAAMKWYGMSNSRPTAAATPFCSVYSPVWQSPGGRPFAWSASQRPIYVINNQ
jgi:hypothetical protein